MLKRHKYQPEPWIFRGVLFGWIKLAKNVQDLVKSWDYDFRGDRVFVMYTLMVILLVEGFKFRVLFKTHFRKDHNLAVLTNQSKNQKWQPKLLEINLTRFEGGKLRHPLSNQQAKRHVIVLRRTQSVTTWRREHMRIALKPWRRRNSWKRFWRKAISRVDDAWWKHMK